MAREAQALTIGARHTKPANFGGSVTAWRALCEVYPSAETAEVIMAVVEYCAVRKLDPYKRPVHVVPIWNSRLRRKIQVVMQGINEVEITASRTGKWAGMDPPKWGPTVERTFRGSFEKDDGSTVNTEVTLRYPEWCSVTVFRLVGEQRAAFTEQLWWEESYGRASFRSEVPNARWQQAPRQMLHKCVKSGVLRAAFPEEATYTAEEMEGRETEGGVTIDGVASTDAATGTVETSSSPLPTYEPIGRETAPEDRETTRERQATVYADPPKPTASERLTAETNGSRWMTLFAELAGAAATFDELSEIAMHPSTRTALERAPSLIQANIRETLRKAHERLAPSDEPPDPLADLFAEIETMDLTTIAGLPENAAWRAKTVDLFPFDYERLDDAVANRKATLAEQEDSSRVDHSPPPTDAGP